MGPEQESKHCELPYCGGEVAEFGMLELLSIGVAHSTKGYPSYLTHSCLQCPPENSIVVIVSLPMRAVPIVRDEDLH